jgi:hypothetical protein
MIPGPLPISDIIQISVQAAAPAVAPLPFNQGLIIGSSAVIPSYGAGARVQKFPSLAAMIAEGFTNVMPEYLAAELYFEQNESALEVFIGRQDLTGIQTAIPHAGAAGLGYAVGDQITVTQGGATFGVLTVLTIGAGGAVTGLGTTIGNQGTGYVVAAGLATVGGSGNGALEVDITVVGETLTQAVLACQLANTQWYGFMVCGAVDADHLALAALSTANWLTMFYFGATADAAVVNGTALNILQQMQALKDRAYMMYSTTQGGTYPNNAYAAAAALGLAMGLNTGAPNSAFDLANKPLVGVAPEPLTETQATTLRNQNCNFCASFGAFIGLLNNGILPSGEYFDQILYRAMLVNKIQTYEMDVLISLPKVPQTNAGQHFLLAGVDQACSDMALIGYIGPGNWTGPAVPPGLVTGQALPMGYMNQSLPYSSQSPADKAARKAMPILCSIIEAGSAETVQVQVYLE